MRIANITSISHEAFFGLSRWDRQLLIQETAKFCEERNEPKK